MLTATARLGRTLAVCGLVAGLVAGCDDDSGSGTAPGAEPTAADTTTAAAPRPDSAPPAEPAAADACELLTVDEVSGLFGLAASIKDDGPSAAITDCVWTGEGEGLTLHQLHLQIYTGAAFYGPDRWAGEPVPVPGLGDEAFLVRDSILGATVGYRQGQQVVFLNYQILLSPGSDPGSS